jgi:hypothetical protein
MRLSLWFVICAAVALALAGCDDLSVNHVLEVKCVQSTGFDGDKLCLKPNRLGAEIGILVNAATQKVQITIIKNDGNWWIKDFILDHCSVVDTRNWKCSETIAEQEGAPYIVRDYGMVHDRFYSSLTGGDSPDYYTSSISGLTFWALRFGIIDMKSALTRTGYSSQALSAFGKER